MQRYEPYYAEDTNGVHFEVCVDGLPVQAYVAGAVLAGAYGPMAPGSECVSAYLAHRTLIDAVVVRRVHAEGRDTILLRLVDLA
ncbi:MAG: DUF1488 family protein [Rubrivivax sp.]|nr:DUF1488 family protein [Rubrivivax sp.]